MFLDQPNQLRSQWTEERVEQMLNLFREGKSASQVAGGMGVTRNAVIGKAHRLGHRIALLNGRTPKLNGHTPSPRERPRLNIYEVNEVRQRPKLKFRPVTSATPRARPRPRLQVAPLPECRCTLLELNSQTCRWPLWRHTENRFYCGSPIAGAANAVYCEHHAQIARRSRNDAHEYVKREPSEVLAMTKRPAKSPKSMVA